MLRSVVRAASSVAVVAQPRTCTTVAVVAVNKPQRRHLNIQAVCNKWTQKSFVDSWRKLEGDLATLRVTAKSLPETVTPIDWNAYRSKMKDKAAVDKLKAEYESKQFDSTPHSFEETDRYISRMEKWYTFLKQHSQTKIAMLEAKIEELHEEKSTNQFWTSGDMFMKWPGLQEQLALRAQRANRRTRYMPHTRIAVFDWTEARKALREGRRPEGLPPPLKTVGNFNREEWDKREKREMEWLESEYVRITQGDDDAPATPNPTLEYIAKHEAEVNKNAVPHDIAK